LRHAKCILDEFIPAISEVRSKAQFDKIDEGVKYLTEIIARCKGLQLAGLKSWFLILQVN